VVKKKNVNLSVPEALLDEFKEPMATATATATARATETCSSQCSRIRLANGWP